MAPKKTQSRKLRKMLSDVPILFMKIWSDPNYPLPIMISLLLGEIAVNIFVINKIKYTEIDWQAYMQEVEGVVNGTYDYMQLKGDTGPLVYPAGFVYIFMALYCVTDLGRNIRLAQYLFAVLYLLTLLVVFDIYRKDKKLPPYVFIFMCCASYRIHSIYILRMFNDPVAMIFMYLAVSMFLRNHWSLGCILYNFGVSVKMNLLLFSPAVFVLNLVSQGVLQTFKNILLCAIVQVILGLPFLLENPVGYIVQSFNFGRQFFYQWTVNWRLLPETLFLNRYFQVSLLVCHVVVLLLFTLCKWKRFLPKIDLKTVNVKRQLSPSHILLIILPLFTANFIGMCFSRSLHYQFYIWYFHTLHYLLWSTSLNNLLRILILGVMELSWNTYPSTVFSSSALHVCHFSLLVALWCSPAYNSEIKKSAAPQKIN
ncbi:hypothetical protein ACJMK2_007612 [Sinanodonta woodiana]|uniref:dolichyl-P-Man:Man5GlcNAc2-PP-dolichol alpha-1,3-mannosyltransferase n=1 Tax=Sinanodonta woodiana TaxID=1069815 RepID=A0ABD3VK39_SINWO